MFEPGVARRAGPAAPGSEAGTMAARLLLEERSATEKLWRLYVPVLVSAIVYV